MAQCGLAGESIFGIKMCKHNGMLGKVISINIRWRVVKGSVSMVVQAQNNTLFKILCERNCAFFIVDTALWHELMVMQIMVLFRRHKLFFSQ